MKYANFLRNKSYRKTFIVYLLIVLLFSSIILSTMYQNVSITARDNFDQDASDSFLHTDRQVGGITVSIDQFLTQLYASPSRLKDFFLFFGSSVEDYLQSKLQVSSYQDESYLSICDSLIFGSHYSIRHMIYYTSENLVDMEYNALGYSRQHIISPDLAKKICDSGCVYQKDIHRNSSYIGKISFVLDLPSLLNLDFTQEKGRANYLILPNSSQQLGDLHLTSRQLQTIMSSSKSTGQLTLNGGPVYYTVHSSEHLPYSLIYLAESNQYLRAQMHQFLLLTLGLALAFGAITMVLVLRFSRDASSISQILSSMERAERSDFTPVPINRQSEEFSAIAKGLNQLYANLGNLIEREYKLTISQQKAQMDMLSAQLSPHFLYNTLERIRMRAVLDQAPDVAEATAGLGLLYRNIVKTEPIITIDRELEITQQYLNLMTFLYGDQFIYHFDIDPAISNTLTPKIWMQPIVENFFKHNFHQDDQLKVIVIEAKRKRNIIEFRFFDNIGSLEDDKLVELNNQISSPSTDSTGIGLRNVIHRLRLYYGERIQMTVENNKPTGVCIRIILNRGESADVPAANCR